MKKLYHMSVLSSSQQRRSAIKRMYMVLRAQYVTTLERRAEIWTILSVIHVSPMSIATGAFTAWMSASTHLERSKYVLASFQMRADCWHGIQTLQLMTKYVLSTF
jgi:hypothetical protein